MKKPKEPPWQPNPKDSVPRRLAAYLFWASQKMPKRVIGLDVIAERVLMLKRKPRTPDCSEIRRIKAATRGACKILLSEHNVGLVNVYGCGLRATFGSEVLV